MKILYHTFFDPSNLKAISNSFKSKISEKTQICFSLIKYKLLFVTKSEETIYCIQRLVKAFKTGA